jgi:hypothetical protein
MAVSSANLKWYYSGGTANTDPNASLGGAISTTEVGTSIHQLFDRVSGTEASTGDTEYRCIYFYNTDTDANGLVDPAVFILSQTSSGDTEIEIGLDPAGKNGTATAVAVEGNAPAGVTFTAPSTYGTGLAFPSSPYVEDDYIAIWIKRIVQSSASSTASDTCSLRVEGSTS